ncbi:hypothetical protein Scep_002189 [Stephania cephalantha]|uniref:Uncharacterized protein n=1 Tax=Stephania cephalantha TaxID=152367 RepID=A0AAP0LAS0_9MAGN
MAPGARLLVLALGRCGGLWGALMGAGAPWTERARKQLISRVHEVYKSVSWNLHLQCSMAKSITEAEGKYAQLLKALDPDLSLKYQKRCEEATREGKGLVCIAFLKVLILNESNSLSSTGGNMGAHSLGMWTIPPVIVDEDCYRSEHLSSKHENLMRNHQSKQ